MATAPAIQPDYSSWPEWQHRVTASKPYPNAGYGPNARITVEAGLHYLRGNSRPYFSVTGDISIPGRRDCESCGQLHDDILKAWPALAPVAALHLSDDRGVPMHLEANGVYHLGFGRYSMLNLAHAASHFRITEAEAEALRLDIISGSGYDRDKYLVFLAQQRPRYHMEADAAIALLDKWAQGEGADV